MACINVNSSVSDQFYRYKMPRLIAKVEGKGNGIKTVVVNMTDIAKALARPPTYPTKFFGCELGAQTQFDLKNDRYIVNGAHDANKLQGLLDGFIKKFVLCPECSNPETNLVILSKKQLILQRCIACGHQGPVDMNHKLTTFILKNPPDQDNAQTPSKGKKAKKSKKQEAVNGDRNSPEANAQEQMAAQRAIGGDILVPPEATDGDDDDWTEDVSEAAVRERMKVLTSAAKGLMLTDDLEKTQEERMNILYNLIKQKKDSDSLAGADKEIVAEAERLEVKEKCPMILVELLFDERILQQIKEHRVLFLRFCHNTPKAQKYLLGGIEILVGNVHKEALLSKVPHILKLLYDHDILDEEVILKWAEKPTKRYVSKLLAHDIRDSAKPFIKWLQEAEEEESDGEEEESEDEVQEIIYTSVAQVGQNKVKTQSAKEEDDIDIDAI